MKTSANSAVRLGEIDATPAIIVMAKTPRAGDVKTRLCPPLSLEAAACFATGLLQDTVTRALTLKATAFVAYTPGDGRAEIERLVPDGLRWLRQRGASLGERMQHAIDDAAALGFGPLLITGTDSPTLTDRVLRDAIAVLSRRETDAVFGPTMDGGYYLVGVQRRIVGLFDSVDWSTSRALADTLRNASRMALSVRMLPTWYDVDAADDLNRLCAEMHRDHGARTVAPATYSCLRRLGLINDEDFDNCPYA